MIVAHNFKKLEIFERSVIVIQSSYKLSCMKKNYMEKSWGGNTSFGQRNLYTHIFDKIEIAHRIAVDMG